MSDPIDCTDCWNGEDCGLHPSAPVTVDGNDVGPAIKAYTLQEKRHEKERDALEKRCALQLETIQDLRLQLDLVTEDRQVEIETRVSATKERDELSAELQETKRILNHVHGTNKRLVAELDHAVKERDELRAELSKQRNIGSDWEREAFKLRRVVDGMGADLDHAIAHYKHAVEVKNRCVASVNRLCSQVVELQAQLRGKE